jgi:ribonuclease BN (tRNA processing enzyme)
VPHIGPTLGYRVTWNGVSVAYIPDHQQPIDASFGVGEGVLELCAGADVVIHDAQYTSSEFAKKRIWGHCTIEYAVHVAQQAAAQRLVLFHHDPVRDDDALDELARTSKDLAACLGMEVTVAAEGSTISL